MAEPTNRDSTSVSTGDNDQEPSGASEYPSRKKVSLACLACRRRRTKCDGGIPCASCLSRNTECVKDENDDGRRKLAIKRRIDTLEKDRRLLDELLDALRTGDASQLNALVNIIQANAGRQEIKAFLSDGFLGAGGAENGIPPSPDTYRRHRHMMGRIQDVVNPPLELPAKPWTTVTDDDEFISHLMTLWFTWAHSWWHWVDEKQFIKAMKAGDTSSFICTPYLVNIILADACLLDTVTEDGAEPNLELRLRFYNEAKRGIDAEEGQVSLAYLAALGVQWTYLNTNGQDQLGNSILYQQVFLIKSVGKWRAKIERLPNITPEHLHAVDLSLGRLEWTLFNLNLFVGLALEQVRLFNKPSRPKPVDFSHTGNTCDERVTWQPYPISHMPIEWHSNCHYLAYISLAEVMSADEALYEENQHSDREELAQKFEVVYTRLQKWPETLPSCMRMHRQAMPHVIALHALHSWVIITMSKQTAALEANSDYPSLIMTPESSQKYRWKEICISEAIRTSDLLEFMRQSWGADHFPVIIIQAATVAAFALLEDLESRPACQTAFYNLCIVIRAASRRFRVNKGVMRLLDRTAKEKGISLPQGSAELLADFNNAMQMNGADSTRLDNLGLDYLLEKWDDLDLEELAD